MRGAAAIAAAHACGRFDQPCVNDIVGRASRYLGEHDSAMENFFFSYKGPVGICGELNYDRCSLAVGAIIDAYASVVRISYTATY